MIEKFRTETYTCPLCGFTSSMTHPITKTFLHEPPSKWHNGMIRFVKAIDNYYNLTTDQLQSILDSME